MENGVPLNAMRDEQMPTRRQFLAQTVAGGLLVRSGGKQLPDAARESRVVTAGTQSGAFIGAAPGDARGVEGIPLCWCPPGPFMMGSPPEEPGRRPDEAQVRVTLTRGFWMAKFEVTQGQWRRVVGEFPERAPTAEFGLGDDVPVYWVNFDAAETFCRRLTERARAAGALPAPWEFRLPTEAQWEYACRAGTITATAFGDRLGRDHANFNGEPLNGGRGGPGLGRAAAVGSYPPNSWGICDMHGNIFEWCRDWYHPRLPGGADPDLYDVKGTPNRDGSYSRIRRGGAWNDPGWACRSALRLRYEPPRSSDHIGFRVVAVQARAGPP
jgi:sulfatase modifying factor 1